MNIPFGSKTTAAEIISGLDLSGKRIFITGGASGLGAETARVLAAAGADVTLAVRDMDVGNRVAKELQAATGNTGIRSVRLDLADLASVAACAAAWRGPLHVLINNAGVMAMPEKRTPQGWEMQFATNHLGHFALALGLRKSLAAAKGARIVGVSSRAHLLSPVRFEDIHFERHPYDPWIAYGQSKTAEILFAVEATRLWSGDGILANALNPGAIATGLQRHVGGTMKTPESKRKTVEQGAATSVLLAASPLVEGIGGRYFEDCQESSLVTPPVTEERGVADYAMDPEHAERLWRLSVDLVD